MNVEINYKSIGNKINSTNIALFVDEKYNLKPLKKYLKNSDYLFINDLLKTSDLKKNILVFSISSKKKIILISIKKNLTKTNAENLGAKFYDLVKNSKESNYNFNSDTLFDKSKNLIGHFLHGIKLKSYLFEKYKTKKNTKIISIYKVTLI